MRPQPLLLPFILPLFFGLLGCGETGEVCGHLGDGVCDEPANCPLGTDLRDCELACASDDPAPELYGACSYREDGLRDPLTVSEDLLARGSGGEGGLYGDRYDSIDAAGASPDSTLVRDFSTYVPQSYDPASPAPLIFYGGGFTDTMYPNAAYTDLNRIAELRGAIIVYIQQDWREWGSSGYRQGWYIYRNAWQGSWEDNPDLDFYLRVMDRMESLYNIDRTRIWVTGTSRGAGMSIMLAFMAPERVAGFISEAGFTSVNEFDGYIEEYDGRKVPGLLLAGDGDNNVSPAESESTAALLESLGWELGEDFLYDEMRGVGHQWQPQVTPEWFHFLYERPLPMEYLR